MIKEFFKNVVMVLGAGIFLGALFACVLGFIWGLWMLVEIGTLAWYFPVSIIFAILLIAGLKTLAES